MKTYDVTVAGVKYELPTKMAVMNAGEKDSGTSEYDKFLESSISRACDRSVFQKSAERR